MRVLLTSHRFPPDGVSGVERVTQAVAAELARRGDEVSIVARRPGPTPALPTMARERLPDGTRIHRVVGGRAEHRWGLRAAYFRGLLQVAERLISPSHYVARYFERFGADPARMRVIPNGIPMEREAIAPANGSGPNGSGTDGTGASGNGHA